VRMIAESAVDWTAAYEAQVLRLGGVWDQRPLGLGRRMTSIWDDTENNIFSQMGGGDFNIYEILAVGVDNYYAREMAAAAEHTAALLGPRPCSE